MNIIKALCHQGQRKLGVEKGAHLLEKIITKYKTPLSVETIKTHKFNNYSGYNDLYNKHLSKNNLVVTLGGDHSIGRASVSSSISKYNNDLMVIWVDAHADINTKKSSSSGNTHGMPLSAIFNLEENEVCNKILNFSPKNLVYYGIRDLDPPEKDIIKMLNIKHFNKLDNLQEYLKINNKRNIHLSFDVDSLDPIYLNSTGTLAPNGITPDNYINLYNYVKPKLVALDIVELNPELVNLNKSIETMDYIIKNTIYR
jgi:arginase